jgi:hypothetical protein
VPSDRAASALFYFPRLSLGSHWGFHAYDAMVMAGNALGGSAVPPTGSGRQQSAGFITADRLPATIRAS